MYVWKRYNWIPPVTVTNPSFTLTEPWRSGYKNLQISKPSFDLNKIGDYKTFFNGFTYQDPANENNKRCLTISGGNLQYGIWIYSMGYRWDYSLIESYNPTGNQSGFFKANVNNELLKDSSYVMTYQGTKTLSGIKGTLKDFVVSNNPNAYPNGALKGNYYYELFGQTTAANTYALDDRLLTNIKNDTITEVQNELNR